MACVSFKMEDPIIDAEWKIDILYTAHQQSLAYLYK